jgi:mono/diheme cytochrome c family protein
MVGRTTERKIEMRGRIAGAAVVLFFGAAAAARAQPGDPQAGQRLALHDCAVCHIVAKKQETKPLVAFYGPSFFDIANREGTSAQSIESFLEHGHPRSRMPAPQLTPVQIRDVTSYILALRGQH